MRCLGTFGDCCASASSVRQRLRLSLLRPATEVGFPVLIATTLLLSSLAAAPASQVYKCRMPNGVLSFQAKPCPRGTHLKTLVVPTAPEPPAAAAPATASGDQVITPDTAPAARRASSSASPPPPAATALPVAAYYKCTRYDGSSYYTASAYARRVRVGLGDLTDPSLAKAPAENGLVWVEDQCSEVPLREACDWYEQQATDVAAKQRTSTGAELKKLVQEHQRLSTIRAARCRR